MKTAARRRAIRRIITSLGVPTQRELADLLTDEGFAVTQATVSRDLKELGAIKVRGQGDEFVYALQVVRRDDGGLERVLAEFANEIKASGNLVVVKTPPGAAQVVAGSVDRSGLDGVLGTVAGDDTVLIVVDGQHGGSRLAETLEQIGVG
ncbi:MAG TPA: arginine repressor [Actinobacteria bacterium]|nr:arginine repressor [bacterium BMS3Bbin01]HDH25492.1 arginine repressor [Actinomycetota bacterium]HDK45875.1 arginine repressor [Actinomycetota bacterium]